MLTVLLSLLPACDARGDAPLPLEASRVLQAADLARPLPWFRDASAPPAPALRARRYPTLGHVLCERMDPMFMMHDRSRRDDLADAARAQIVAFLTHPAHADALGHAESQAVARFFETTRVDHRLQVATDVRALEAFLAFWLDVASVRVTHAFEDGDAPTAALWLYFQKGAWETVAGI
jgi:hypothetical protein